MNRSVRKVFLAITCLSIAAVGWAAEPIEITARDTNGHGLLCRSQGKTILLVGGTPEEMGTAHGELLGDKCRQLVERVVFAVGGAESIRSGRWFFERMVEIGRRAGPHVPPRFFAECDALARAVGVSQRNVRAANLFPELFHCSGLAVRGKATADGRVLHARVLDYMRDVHLQEGATVTVFMPRGYYAWISLGYAGFVGTVTAMNEKGVAIGEMGGRGQGDWDGVPMSFLLRDVMERCADVHEAVELIRAARRTCEYYYVVSDKHRNMAALACTPKEITVLGPGQQHPLLPHVPDDTVYISAGERAKTLGQRIRESYGKIDVPGIQQMIKRPVAMASNLHDAIFSPETLEMWCADAGDKTPACDEPYARVKLDELIALYKRSGGKL